jgi:glycosyltransferase involved in cell wall biosynthesis
VVILTRNSARTLEGCLKSVLREEPREIIAVDAGSEDSTLNILRSYKAHVLTDSTGSIAHQRLLGVQAANGVYVMFVDSDVELGLGCIGSLHRELEEQNWVGIHARIYSAENLTYWQRSVDEEFANAPNWKVGPKRQIGTAAALFRRKVLLAYPFDTYLKESHEDVDLSRRLVNDGWLIGVSTSIAYHYHRRNFVAFVKQRFRGGVGRARLAAKYKENPLAVFSEPLLSAYSRMVRSMGTRKIRLIPYWTVFAWAGSIGILVGFSRVRKSSCRHNESQSSNGY